MSSKEKKEEKNYILDRKDSSLSEPTVKTTISYSNPQINKKAIFTSFQNIPLNTNNFNFTNSNFVKTLNFSNNNEKNRKNYNPSSSSLSTTSTPLIQKQNIINISPSKENENNNKQLLNSFQYNNLVNNLNVIFSKIQNLSSQNYPSSKECNLWIENFKNIYFDIIEKNKENEFYELIKNTLMLMFFTMIIIYDINNKNKQRFFNEDIKNILNIHNLMSESIYGNSFNNPKINPKDESQVLMLSCKDMNNKISKILNQYNRICEEDNNCNFFPLYKKLKNESFDNVYNFYINDVRNPIHVNINNNKLFKSRNSDNNNFDIKKEKIIHSINNVSLSNQNNNTNIMNKTIQRNQIYQNNNVTNLNGVGAFFDSSNNVFLFRKPLKSSTPNKQREIIYQKTQMTNPQLNNINPQYSNYSNIINNTPLTPQKLYSNNQLSKIINDNNNLNNNNNYIIQNDPRLTIQEKKYDENTIKKEIQSSKQYISQNITYYNKLNSQNSNIKNPNFKTLPKTPVKIRSNQNQNIGKLNLNVIRNQSLTPIKKNNNKNEYNNNNILIPFPPSKPYTLVLDLDETLVNVPKNSNIIILRPGLRNFLHSLLPFYELIIFTTGMKEYADQIINFIENEEKFFSFRLYRQNATWFNENYYKDLNKLGRDIKKIIIVDDKKICMEFQEANGIIIKPFVFNPNNPNDDYILFDLIRILIRIAKEKPDDVRESLKLYREEIYNKVSGF